MNALEKMMLSIAAILSFGAFGVINRVQANQVTVATTISTQSGTDAPGSVPTSPSDYQTYLAQLNAAAAQQKILEAQQLATIPQVAPITESTTTPLAKVKPAPTPTPSHHTAVAAPTDTVNQAEQAQAAADLAKTQAQIQALMQLLAQQRATQAQADAQNAAQIAAQEAARAQAQALAQQQSLAQAQAQAQQQAFAQAQAQALAQAQAVAQQQALAQAQAQALAQQQAAAQAQAAAEAAAALPTGKYRDGSYTGSSVYAVYGYVQVQAVVQSDALASVRFLSYPSDRRTSQQINAHAMPILIQEAIQAQSAQVDGVSGASETTKGFVQSLGNALAQAHV